MIKVNGASYTHTDNPQIVLMNGPIGSGKDVIGREIKKLFGASCQLVSFKDMLYIYVRTYYDLSQEEIEYYELRQNKEVPQDRFYGKSFRQILIHTSEVLVKPVYGESIFGVQLGVRIKSMWPRPKLVVVTDSGFDAEFKGLCHIVQPYFTVSVTKLWREGCEFGPNDSRSYLSDTLLASKKIPTLKLDNNNITINEAARKVLKFLDL